MKISFLLNLFSLLIFFKDSVTETNYDLFAVVIHKGTCYTGHYYGYIKDIDEIGMWIQPPPPSSPSPVRLEKKTSIFLKKYNLILNLDKNNE